MFERLVTPPEGITFPQGAEVAVLTTADNRHLRAAFWPAPGDGRKGTVFVLHGRSEYIEKYAEVFTRLLAKGYAIATLDWRGQGGSERLLHSRAKGHIEEFEDYLIDLDALYDEAKRRALPEPYSILAHSMGGAITILALATGTTRFRRAILSAPLVEIALPVFQSGARVLARFFVSIGFSAAYIPGGGRQPIGDKPFENNPLTSDQGRYDAARAWIKAEPYIAIGDPTIGWIDAAFNALETFKTEDFGEKNRTPILMMLAGKDRVVSSRAAARLAARMRGASAIELSDSQHEILLEKDTIQERFWSAFDAFITPPEAACNAASATNESLNAAPEQTDYSTADEQAKVSQAE